jgi:hypothetical protein
MLAALLAACCVDPLCAQTVERVIVDALEGNGDCRRAESRCTRTSGRFSGVGGLGITTNPQLVAAALKQQITALPLGTSSGGFTWEFDPSVSLMVRRTRSFGPVLGDRPITIGARKFSIGVTFQHTEWRSLAGQDLQDGIYGHDLFLDDFYIPPIQPVLEQFGSRLDLSTERTTVNLTYGISSRLDFNVIVPFARTNVSGGPDYSYTLVTSGTLLFRAQDTVTRSANGLSDISMRGKYVLMSRRRAAVAAIGELRLPTGVESNLLGTGKLATRVSAVGSVMVGPVSPRLEVGFLFAGKGLTFAERFGRLALSEAEPSDEVTYSLGADAAVADRVTVSVDVLGRTLLNSAKILQTVHTMPDSLNPAFTREIIGYTAEPGKVSLLLGTVGAKFQVATNWLLTASVLVALNEAGVKPQPTPVIGFERAF